jgi:membrane protease YdiL (CAAX protease family)
MRSPSGDIAAPPRSDLVGSAATFVVVAAYSTSGLLRLADRGPVVVVLAVATLVAIAFRSPYAAHAGILTIVYSVVLAARPLAELWPLPIVVILAIEGAIAWGWPWLRRSNGWLRRGHIDRTGWAMIAGFVAMSATALVVWRYWTDTNMSVYRGFVPNVPRWMLPFGLLAFAALNAAFEEIIWRGVLMYALESAMGPAWGAWLVQGVGFGIWHFQGFPRGWVGVGLATIFALMMGALRMRSKGMLAPFIAHVFADVTIFALVTAFVLGSS